MKTLLIAALAAALLATPVAMADTVTLNAPRAGSTLQSSDVAMSLYFTKVANEGFEVVATYVSDAAQPRRIVMNLSDGDSLKFGLPGHAGTLYEFARSGDVVTVSDEIVSGGGF